MNIEELREYCFYIKGCTESLPFLGHNVLVFKIMDKMFAYIPLEPKDGVFKVNLKCSPDKSVELREKYRGIAETDFKTLQWNLVTLDSDVPDESNVNIIYYLPKQFKSSIVFLRIPKCFYYLYADS